MQTLKPTTLTLITTYRCTAACPNCCFNCSPQPQITEMMPLEKIKEYISSAIQCFPSLKVVVFTGGECTLLGDNLIESIKFAKSLGLSTRIVTNGHWGKDIQCTSFWINSFAEVGLDEINFSTGDEHSLFIPIDALTYAVSECAKLNQFGTILVNIETLSSHHITEKDILYSNYVVSLEKPIRNKIQCIKSPWIEFRRKSINNDKNDSIFCIQRPCREVLTSINISPTGQFLSCCGFASEYSPFLKLGQVTNENLSILHKSRFDDLLKIWLYTSGPYEILKELGCAPENSNKHACEYCHWILQDKNILQKLLSIDENTVSKIILDYNLIITKDEKVNKTTCR